MEVYSVSHGWKIILFILYSGLLALQVATWNKWLLFPLFILGAIAFNGLVNGQFWVMPIGQKNKQEVGK